MMPAFVFRYNSAMFKEMFQLNTQPYSIEDAEWDAFVQQHPHGSLLQTTQWATLKSQFGWQSQRVWLKKEGQLVAGAIMLIRSWGWGMIKMAYIPHGPLVDWNNKEQVEVLLNQIDQAAYQRRAGILKMEPLLWQDEMPADYWQNVCTQHGCLLETDTIQPPRTVHIDLRGSDEDILARMKQKTRYNIRLADKKGVTVRAGTAEDMLAFNQLMAMTGHRNQFGVHEPAYYKTAYELFAPDQCVMLLAEYEGKVLAGLMIFALGKTAYYLFGGSSHVERKRMPTYALQWAAIQWAKARGCTTYDLWGIPDADEETLEANFQERNDGLWGVYRNKRGYGGQIRRTVGSVDRVYNPLLYRLYQWRRGTGA